MITIKDALNKFLKETGEGNRKSSSSPFSVIDWLCTYLDSYAHEDLEEFDQARFDKEYNEGKTFCDIFGPDHIEASHINSFLNTFIPGKVMATKSLLKACGPLMEKLAAWLRDKGYWDQEKMDWFRELVGDEAGEDLGKCDAFGQALYDYVEDHPLAVDANDVADKDYLEDQFTIKKVEVGRLHLDPMMADVKNLIVTLPSPLTKKARKGWLVSMELARIRGKWRIMGVGNVYPL